MEAKQRKLSDEHKRQIAEGRARSLKGKSPRERGLEKARAALDWIYRWGWASPSTIELVGGAERSGLAARLVRAGLLRSTQTEAGGAVKGVPVYMLTLTETGQAEVERFRETLLPYVRDPYRIRQDQLRHYQLAQAATAKALRNGTIVGFLTEREVFEVSVAGVKQVDVTWLLADQRIGVEIELTAKWSRDLDVFILGCLLALSPLDGKPPKYTIIAVVSDSPAIIKRYKAAFEPGKCYQTWQKNNRGIWQVAKNLKVPDWAQERMQWQLITD